MLKYKLLLGLVICCGSPFAQQPIQICKENPHYFQYNGKPILLISSAGNYNGISKPNFDYETYFDSLGSFGMNLKRVFSGANIWLRKDKNTGKILTDVNILTPWARSGVEGYIGGGNKFDLDKWNDDYFARLKKILTSAALHGVFIEYAFFSNHYDDSVWINSPLYPENNIQRVGPSGSGSFKLFQTGSDKRLTEKQDSLVTKVVRELNSFDNLYYEICNEPYNEIQDTTEVDHWSRHLAELIKRTEDKLPKRHLIASNQSIVNNPDISVANYHYVHIWDMPDFDWLYSLKKVISMDETLILPTQEDVDDMRIEAWDYILKGGGVYNNLCVKRHGNSDSLQIARSQLRNLHRFMDGFNFIHMSPDRKSVVLKSKNAVIRSLSEKGKQYAAYIHHSTQKGNMPVWGYDAIKGNFRDTMELNIPVGHYLLRWIDPSTGKSIGQENAVYSRGKEIVLFTPVFETDIAASLFRK